MWGGNWQGGNAHNNLRCRAERCNIICAPQSLRLAAAGCWIPSSQLSGRNQGGEGGGRVPILCCAHSGTPISSQIGSISGNGM